MPKYYRKTFKVGLIVLVLLWCMSAVQAQAQYPWTPLFERKVETANGIYGHLAFCSGYLKWTSQYSKKYGIEIISKRILEHSQWMRKSALQFAEYERIFILIDKVKNWNHEIDEYSMAIIAPPAHGGGEQ